MTDNEREVFSVSPGDVARLSDFLGSEADLAPPYPQSNGVGVQGGADINDLNLQTETVEIDPEADSTVVPPPVSDGIHEFNLLPIDKSSFGKDRAQWGVAREKFTDGPNKGKRNPDGDIRWLWASLDYEAVEPGTPHDKAHVFENYVSTMVGTRTPTSRVATLLGKLGVKVPSRASHVDYMNLLIRESQKRPPIGLETRCDVQCQNCAKEAKARGEDYPSAFLVGEDRFPVGKNGKRIFEVECPKCGTLNQARAQVVHYHRSKRAQAQVAMAADAGL